MNIENFAKNINRNQNQKKGITEVVASSVGMTIKGKTKKLLGLQSLPWDNQKVLELTEVHEVEETAFTLECQVSDLPLIVSWKEKQ